MLFSIYARSRVVLSWSLLLLACSSVPQVITAQSAADDAALGKLAEKFFDLYQKMDLDGLTALWSDKSPHLVTFQQEAKQTFAANKLELRSLIIRKVTVSNDKATIRAVVEINAEDLKTGKAADGFGIINRTFHLLREGGEAWKIWQYVASERELAAALISAKSKEERKVLLEAEKDAVTVELVRALLPEGRRSHIQGAYSIALDIYELALSLAEQLNDGVGKANALRGIGIVHHLRGSYTEALEYYEKALKLSEEIGAKEGIANTLNNIGIVHNLQGGYRQALEYYQRSLKISREIDNKQAISATLNNIGIVHISQDSYTQALEYYEESLKISEEIGDKLGAANALTNIGVIHYLQGNYTQALEHFQRSLKINKEQGNRRGIANGLNNLALVPHLQGNYTQALEYYKEGLKLSEAIGDKLGAAAALGGIGAAHRSRGEYTDALEYYQRSLKISQEIGEKRRIAAALDGIGDAHYSQGDYIRARENFAAAIAAVEQLRERVAGAEPQHEQFFQTKLSPYHQMIKLSLKENKPVEAFGYAERVKGRALLDTLVAGRVDVTKAMTYKEKAEERSLNAEVVSLNTRIYQENLRIRPDKAILADLEARREKARARYEAFHINLYAAHPELKTQRGEMKPISLGEVGKLIPNSGTAILEYVVTEDKTYLFVLTRRQQSRGNPEPSTAAPVLNVYAINVKQKELADRVHRFHGRLMQKDLEFSKSSREMYDLLIGPARSDLKDKTSLVIVSDGVLWQVPFQALQPSANHFLIQVCAISYAPSLTVLREMMNVRRKRKPASGALQTLVAFGNPDVDPTTAANLRTAYPEVLADEKLHPLPQTEDMLKRLSRLYGPDRSKIYVRAEAREDRAKKEAGTCRILQFATHGILDNTNSMYSRLVMSQSGVGKHEDGMLEAWEIMNLDLNAEIAILSACDTGRGRVAGGLAWAFFVARCPTTVVSQWPVEVNSTTELMIEFHKRLKPVIEGRRSNVSKAEALRAAMLKLMKSKRYRHPFYWAPFVVIGDSR